MDMNPSYVVEGGLDFYSELNHSSDEDEDSGMVPKERCLISNEPLDDHCVELPCGHAFNYLPLLNDVHVHKYYYQVGERSKGRLNMNELRCPYCRAKHVMFLPYYPELGVPKLLYVNWYDPTHVYVSPHADGDRCMYTKINHDFDPSKPEGKGNTKTYKCCENGAEPIQIRRKHGIITYSDTHSYCAKHRERMIDFYKEREKNNVSFCEAVLKSGSRKGQKCGCMVHGKTALCGKHVSNANRNMK